MANAVIEAKQGEVIGTESLFANENTADESIEEVVANSEEQEENTDKE